MIVGEHGKIYSVVSSGGVHENLAQEMGAVNCWIITLKYGMSFFSIERRKKNLFPRAFLNNGLYINGGKLVSPW